MIPTHLPIGSHRWVGELILAALMEKVFFAEHGAIKIVADNMRKIKRHPWA